MCKKLQLRSPDLPSGALPLDPLGLPSSKPPDWPVFILGFSGGEFQKSLAIKFDETEAEARIHGWMTLGKILVSVCLYCLNCMKFGQLILSKIITIVATRCQILRLKCTKFDIGWGSAPDPGGGAYSAPQTP